MPANRSKAKRRAYQVQKKGKGGSQHYFDWLATRLNGPMSDLILTNTVNSQIWEDRQAAERALRVSNTIRAASDFSRAEDPLRVFGENELKEGAELAMAETIGTDISIAVANTHRSIELTDVGSVISGESGDAEKMPIFDVAVNCLDIRGNKPFYAMVSIAILENGQTVVATNSASNSPIVAAKAAIDGGDFDFEHSEIFKSKPFNEGNTASNRICLVFNMTGWLNRYSAYYRKSELEEKSPVVCKGILTVGGVASTTITFNSVYGQVLHTVSTRKSIM